MKIRPTRFHILRIILCLAVIAEAFARSSFLSLDTPARRIVAAVIGLALVVISILLIYISIAGIMDNFDRHSHKTSE